MNRSLKISQVVIASVAHQGACWTWNLRAWDLFPLRVTFYHWIFLFSQSKYENATIGISVWFVKNSTDSVNTLPAITYLSSISFSFISVSICLIFSWFVSVEVDQTVSCWLNFVLACGPSGSHLNLFRHYLAADKNHWSWKPFSGWAGLHL